MFDWVHYIHLAEKLLQAPDEASQRSAISRAYYAVYGVACRLKPNTNKYTGSSHKGYWDQWIHDPSPAKQKLYIDGNRLWKYRKQADYDSVGKNSSRDATTAVNIAKKLLTEIQDLSRQGLF